MMVLTTVINSQVHPDSVLTVQEMHDDLDSLLHTILISHPKPGGFVDALSLETAFVHAKTEITDAQTILQFAQTLAQLMQLMADSHSSLDYGQLQQMSFAGDGYLLPFSCFYFEQAFYLERDWEDKIPRGSRLISINSMPIEELNELALKYACIEGEAIGPQQRIAEALMPIVASLYTNADSTNSIVVVPFGEKHPRTYKLSGYQNKTFKKMKAQRIKLDENQILDFDFNADFTRAELKVGTFAPMGARHYRRFIRNAFRDIAIEGVDTLLLDLRDNGGGSSSWVEYLYAFIDTAGHNTPSNVIARNSELAVKRNKAMNRSFTKFILRTFYKKNEDVISFLRNVELPFGHMDTTYFFERTRQRKDYVFNGTCILLINGLTASAGVDFTNSFKTKQRGVVVGEPCLGPASGTWGNPSIFTLPQSGLRISIATIRYNYNNSFRYETEPIAPDHIVLPTPSGIHDKRDEVIDFIIRNN